MKPLLALTNIEKRSLQHMSESHLESDGGRPPHDPLVRPNQNVPVRVLAIPPPLLDRVAVEVDQLETLDGAVEAGPVERVDQLQLRPEILLGEVVQHPGVDEALHKSRAVLRKAWNR